MKDRARMRLLWVSLGVVMLFSGFSYRLINLQVQQHDHFEAIAADKHIKKQPIYAQRGSILDSNNEVIANNVPVKTVIADASQITDPERVAAIVAETISMPIEAVREKLATGKKFIVLKKRVPEEDAATLGLQLQKAHLQGIYFDQESIRIYPNGRSLCHVIGFTNSEYEGMDGVERTMNSYLRGVDGYRYIEHDRKGSELVPYRGQERAAQNGLNVQLTVDLGLQNIVESELEIAVAKYRPKAALAVLMRPSTGEILALASSPNFDPAAIADAKPEDMRNRVITDMVEPGSTFKIVTISAVLNERIVKPETTVYCEGGRFLYAGKILRDHHPYGSLSVHDVLMKSSNIGSAKLAMQLGDDRLYEYIRRFGFGTTTGLGLPGEIVGMVHPVHDWTKISITRVPMGHEVCVTPIQLVAAMGAIANGGKLVTPHIIKGITDAKGRVVASFPSSTVREVVSPSAAAQVSAALKDVVSKKGTAFFAKVPGFSTCGKTGTAQKVDPKGGYTPGKYVVSFLGYFPQENPEIVGLVMLDDAITESGLNYGGLVAAPIFSRIGEKAARYLDLQPTEPIIPILSGTNTPLVADAHKD